MMKLGHISDLHILEVEDVRPWHFLNKRLIGGANLLLKRNKRHQTAVVEKAQARTTACPASWIPRPAGTVANPE